MDARSATAAASLALAVLAACGGGSADPHAPPPASARGAGAVPPAVPALAGGGERAFVIDSLRLVELSTAGASQVVSPGASWCNVDARANVVWFVTSGGLQALDLVDRRVRTIIKGKVEDVAVIIDWKGEQLGGESELLFDVAAAIRMTARPYIEMTMGCFGDRMRRCYELDMETLKPEVVQQQRLVERLDLADPAYVASLAERGKGRSLWSPRPPEPAPPRRKPVVDPSRCEDPARCGTLIPIPGSSLWLVHVSSGRGDFGYYEERELWDPATGEYIHRDRDKLVRSKTLLPEWHSNHDFAGLRVSPRGVLTHGAAVFDGTKVYRAPSDPDRMTIEGDLSCGWVGGGWRVPGPLDL